MAKTEPFDAYSDAYDDWFERHGSEYALELEAVRELLPSGQGLEIGVGTGKFARPLGIQHGLDPSEAMIKKAREVGIEVVEGIAEQLPYTNDSFDFALMLTTICFVDDLKKSFEEACRVLKPGGSLVTGFIDKESTLGQQYLVKRDKSRFYSVAEFYSAREVLELLRETGFAKLQIRQTLLANQVEQNIIDGYGQGSFVAIQAIKQIKPVLRPVVLSSV